MSIPDPPSPSTQAQLTARTPSTPSTWRCLRPPVTFDPSMGEVIGWRWGRRRGREWRAAHRGWHCPLYAGPRAEGPAPNSRQMVPSTCVEKKQEQRPPGRWRLEMARRGRWSALGGAWRPWCCAQGQGPHGSTGSPEARKRGLQGRAGEGGWKAGRIGGKRAGLGASGRAVNPLVVPHEDGLVAAGGVVVLRVDSGALSARGQPPVGAALGALARRGGRRVPGRPRVQRRR